MVLPPILAMNAREIAASAIDRPVAWLSCHFSPCEKGLTNLPLWLPPGSMLFVDDLIPCQGHSADLAAEQLSDIVSRFRCEGVILDFQQPENGEIPPMISKLSQALPCPVAVSDLYAVPFQSAVFLSPGHLWEPMENRLMPWSGRDIWLDASLCQQQLTVTANGTAPGPLLPWNENREGFYDDTLRCHYRTEVAQNAVTFTLFDTPQSMTGKLELAQSLGVSHAIGLWRELGTFLMGK